MKPRDVNDMLREHGDEFVRRAFDEAFRSAADSDRPFDEAFQSTEDSEPPKGSPIKFTLYADIDREPRKRWLVRGFLGAGELSCVFGAPRSGKSVLVTDLAAHVAARREWFSRPVGGGAVLIVAAERATLVKRRLAAFRLHYRTDDLPLGVISGSIDLRTSRSCADAIIARASDLQRTFKTPLALIIVDTVSRALSGGDENSPKDMGALVGQLGSIQEATGAHVCAVHHIPADGAQRMRGHSLFLGACDTTVCVEKGDILRTAMIDKTNDGPEGERITFTLQSVDLHHDPQTGETTTAPVIVPADGAAFEKAKPKRKVSDKQRIALEALANCDAETPPASFGLAIGVLVVPLRQWRDELFRRGVLDRHATNPREDFRRLKMALQAHHLIGGRDDYVWPIRVT